MKVDKQGSVTFTISGEKATNPAVLAFINAIVSEDELHLRALETIYSQLPKIVNLIETSTTELTDKFKVLAAAAKEQADDISKFSNLTKSLDFEGKSITVKEAMELINRSNTYSVETVLRISKNSVETLYSLNETLTDISQVQSFISDLEGKASEEIKGKLANITRNIERCCKTLEEICAIDMGNNVITKNSLDVLTNTILNQNFTLSKVMKEAMDEANKASQNIRAMTISMQFQDKASQWITYSLDVIKLMLENIKARKENINNTAPVAISAPRAIQIANAFRLGELQNYFADQLVANKNLESKTIFTAFSGADEAGSLSEKDDSIKLF